MFLINNKKTTQEIQCNCMEHSFINSHKGKSNRLIPIAFSFNFIGTFFNFVALMYLTVLSVLKEASLQKSCP